MATTAAAMAAKARRDVISHFMARDAVSPASLLIGGGTILSR